MEAATTSAVISATSGIVGVLLGTSLTAVKEWAVGRSKRKQDLTYLGIIVGSHLDRLFNACVDLAHDDGTAEGQPAQRETGEHVPTVAAPVFRPLDIDVEWKALPTELLYKILRFPDEIDGIQAELRVLADFVAFPPDYVAYFRPRRRKYAELGLRVYDTATRLRKHAGLPIESVNQGNWSPLQSLREVVEIIDREEADAARRATSTEL